MFNSLSGRLRRPADAPSKSRTAQVISRCATRPVRSVACRAGLCLGLAFSVAPGNVAAQVRLAPQAARPTGQVHAAVQQVQFDDEFQPSYDGQIESIATSDRKLEVIERRSKLMVTRRGVRRIFFSDPTVATAVQFSPTEWSILGTGLGTTDMVLWFEGSDEPMMFSLTTVPDPDAERRRRIDYGKIERELALLYPNSKVYLIPIHNKIIVRGQARDTQEAANIMQVVRGAVLTRDGALFAGYTGGLGFTGLAGNDFNTNDLLSSLIVDELQVPGEYQVNVRVRIAELSRSQLRRAGIDFTYLFNSGRHVVSQALGATPLLTGIFESGEIEVLVNYLASNGTVKIVEDSSVTVMSGDSASFLSGGEFAVPTTVGVGGAAAATTTFRGFGTSIICTPTVVDHDLIGMRITPELSSIDGGNTVGGIPGVNVTRVNTRVELREGQTIVLGGLFSRKQNTEVTRIPFLGEIPYIGTHIFNAKQATEDETEVLIVVTPEIVRPMDPEEVPPMPGFYVTHPDCYDFYKLSRTEGTPDLGVYQLMPIGNQNGYAQDVGYSISNPAPAQPDFSPQPAGGFPAPGYGVPGGGYPRPNMHSPPPVPALPMSHQQGGHSSAPARQAMRPPATAYQAPQQNSIQSSYSYRGADSGIQQSGYQPPQSGAPQGAPANYGYGYASGPQPAGFAPQPSPPPQWGAPAYPSTPSAAAPPQYGPGQSPAAANPWGPPPQHWPAGPQYVQENSIPAPGPYGSGNSFMPQSQPVQPTGYESQRSY